MTAAEKIKKNEKNFELLQQIYSGEQLSTDDDTRKMYGTCTIPDRQIPQCVVFPSSAEQVSATLKIANETQTPIYYFSTGKNWGYGTTRPIDSQSIVMILERMNKIREYNAELGYAVIEPGVTQQQFFNFLKNQGAKHWMDCTDSTPTASVLGNALERGVGYTPYGDHFGSLCGLEVALANGDVVQLDSLAGDPSRTFHTYKWGTGPFLDGLFTQSNLGIVLSAGIWLMPVPEDHNYFLLELKSEKNLPELVNKIRKLGLDRLISNAHILNAYITSFGYEKFPSDLARDAYVTIERREEIYKKWNIHPWIAFGAIYGTREQVASGRKRLSKMIGSDAKIFIFKPSHLNFIAWLRKKAEARWLRAFLDWACKLFAGKSFSQIELVPDLFTFQRGEPSEFFISKAYYKNQKPTKTEGFNPARDNCGLYWLAPIVPAIGQEITDFVRYVEELHQHYQTNAAISLIQVNTRTFIVAIFMTFDKDSPADEARARKLYEELATSAQVKKYQHYRTAVVYMDRILQKGSASSVITSKLKEALDPNHILAPGRYGP